MWMLLQLAESCVELSTLGTANQLVLIVDKYIGLVFRMLDMHCTTADRCCTSVQWNISKHSS